MSISWSDYEEVDSVYLMVKKIDPALDTFSFTMKFTSEKNAPMSVAGKFFLGLFITILICYTIIYTLYKLHLKGVIEVRIPKIFRIYCFKNYLSPEEKEALKIAEKLRVKLLM